MTSSTESPSAAKSAGKETSSKCRNRKFMKPFWRKEARRDVVDAEKAPKAAAQAENKASCGGSVSGPLSPNPDRLRDHAVRTSARDPGHGSADRHSLHEQGQPTVCLGALQGIQGLDQVGTKRRREERLLAVREGKLLMLLISRSRRQTYPSYSVFICKLFVKFDGDEEFYFFPSKSKVKFDKFLRITRVRLLKRNSSLTNTVRYYCGTFIAYRVYLEVMAFKIHDYVFSCSGRACTHFWEI